MKRTNHILVLTLATLGPTVFLIFVLFMCFQLFLESRPIHGLRGRVSHSQAGIRYLEDRISILIREKTPLPSEIAGAPPFVAEVMAPLGDRDIFQKNGLYRVARLRSGWWFVFSFGPDCDQDITMTQLVLWEDLSETCLSQELDRFSYSPTNGILSSGDLCYIGESPFARSANPSVSP